MSDQTIGQDSLVSVHYVLRDGDGNELDASPEGATLSYIHGRGQIVPGLEKALEGRSVGDVVRVVVPPEDGYGTPDPDRLVRVPRERFDFVPEPGGLIRAEWPGGGSHPFKIVEVTEEHVVLDGNHPLAGEELDFEVTVAGIRMASEEELADTECGCGCH